MPSPTDTNNASTRERGAENRQSNDSGDPALEIDRDVQARPIRDRKDLIHATEAPIPPVPEPNASDYRDDPSSKESDNKSE